MSCDFYFIATVCEEAIFIPEAGFSIWQFSQEYVCSWIWAHFPLHWVQLTLRLPHWTVFFLTNLLLMLCYIIFFLLPLFLFFLSFSCSVQEFWGDGGPDNGRYEDTSAEFSAWSWGLRWWQGPEERKRITQPNTEHRDGRAGEPNVYKDSNTSGWFLDMSFLCLVTIMWRETCQFWFDNIYTMSLFSHKGETECCTTHALL